MCKRRTRGDRDSADLRLCAQCYELGGADNSHNDNDTPPTDKEMVYYETLVAKIEKSGGDGQKVREFHDYIWTPTVLDAIAFSILDATAGEFGFLDEAQTEVPALTKKQFAGLSYLRSGQPCRQHLK
jgi:hypothetical protein